MHGNRLLRRVVPGLLVSLAFVTLARAERRIGFLWENKTYDENGFELVREICHKDDLTAFYVIGKSYEMLAGPLPASADKNLPFVEEVEAHGSLWGRKKDGQAICELLLNNLKKKLPQHRIWTRWGDLSTCASSALSALAPRVANEVRQLHLGHAYWQDPEFLCELLKFPNVKAAIEPAITLQDEYVSPSAAPATHDDANEDEMGRAGEHTCKSGACDGTVAPPVSVVTNPHDGRQIVVPCTLSQWRFCPDAKQHERELATLAAKWGVWPAVESGQRVFQEQLCGTVNDAYRWVLARDATPDEIAVAGSKQVDDVAKLLRHTEEFTNKCADGRCLDLARETIQFLFKDILLRHPDSTALESYALLLQNTGSKSEVQRALVMSTEYEELCRTRQLSCLQAKEEVMKVFRSVLKRDVELEGLISYARELVLGHTSAERIREDLRNSDEYKSKFGEL